LSNSIFTAEGRLAFDSDFLKNHGFKKKLSILKKLTQLNGKIKKCIKLLFVDDSHLQLKAFANIWDDTENALSSTDCKRKNKFLSWDIIKSYNYYNEIFPIMNKMKNPEYYLEIGSGGCHLPSIIKDNFSKKMKIIFIMFQDYLKLNLNILFFSRATLLSKNI
jgi:hypothetical protein